MSISYQNDSQRAFGNPMVYNNGYNNYPQMNMPQHYNPILFTNDPSVLWLSGNSYTIASKGEEFSRQGPSSQIKSLRINITGSVIKTFDYCCMISTMLIGSILIFPLFFVCCDWWKRKTFPIF